MNKKVSIIKRLVFILLFLLCIFALYKAQDLKQYNDFIYYDIDQIDDFKNMDIEVDNLILNITPTNNSYIKISRDTTFRRYNSMDYSSNYVDGTLKIKKFVKKETERESRDVLTVEIPASTKLDTLSISANNSEVNINELNTKNLNIISKTYLKLSLNNSTLENSIINSEELYSSVNNSYIKERIEYNLEGGSIENKDVSGKEEEITNLNLLTYSNETSSFDKTKFNGSNVNLSFLLGSSIKYRFENTTNKTKVDKIKLTDDGTSYTYNEEVKDLKEYVIECNNNPITSLKTEQKEAIRSEIE